jgi:oligopeptidase B
MYAVSFTTGTTQKIYESSTSVNKQISKSKISMTQVSIPSRDVIDTLIPMTIVHTPHYTHKPTLVVVYGAYGKSLPMFYKPYYHELVDRGWNLAFAHVRGGGELGPSWHSQGKLQNKHNSFLDFKACIEYLLTHEYTTPSLLCAEGDSAGGLILGHALNTIPQYISGVITRNGFFHISHEVVKSTSALHVHEYEEWGHPTNSNDMEYIQSYCPHSNIVKQSYPAVYAYAGLLDTIVDPKHSIEWIEKLSEHQVADSVPKPIILRTGQFNHCGPSDTKSQCYESALEIAFLEHCVSH